MKAWNYPTEGSLNRPSFIKIMIGDFGDMMKIPPAFRKHIRGECPGRFILSSSGRGYWVVHANKVDGNIFLMQGWTEFVLENNLRKGTLLVFHYQGNSRFHVSIFGMDCCLKNNIGKSSRENHASTQTTKAKAAAAIPKRKASSVGLTWKNKSKNGFRVVMRRTYIKKRYMSIPIAMMNCLGDADEDHIKLKVGEKTWDVKLKVYPDCYKLGGGWPAFVRENELKVGDVCYFEVTMQEGEICLLVTITRGNVH